MSLQNAQAELTEAIFSDHARTDNIKFSQNISIYRNNYYSALTNALKNTYPMVRKLVGDDFFVVAAKEYIHHYPSRNTSLDNYGEYLSDFLIEYPPVKNLVYLADVALFEWICHLVYHAAEHPGFDISSLQDVPQDQYDLLHLTLNPASRLLHSHYPLLKIIDLCHGAHTDEIDLQQGQTHLLIIRREFEVSLITLSEAEFTFLSNIYEGYSILDALNEALSVDPAFKLEEKLPLWVQEKVIVDYR